MSTKGRNGGEKTGGRVKGTPNKATAELKEMILNALDMAGGESYLMYQAMNNPGPFLQLVGKVLPLQVAGGDGKNLKIEIVTAVPEAEPDEPRD